MSGSRHNILVISDLHLGEDIRPEVDNSTHFEELGAELTAFLHHYATNRHDNTPWRLIVNGDMVDFLSVCLMPQDVEMVEGLGYDDHTYGLGTRPNAALLKMNAVLERHADVFEAFAHFIGQGNELNIIVGNHDAEFVWEEVQEGFVEGIVQIWKNSNFSMHDGCRSPDAVREAINFHPWFYFEEDFVWVEHGHQYDRYCSVDHILDPRDSTDEQELEQNVGDAVMYYLANHLPDSPEDQQKRGFVQYMRMPFERSGRAVQLLSGYGRMSWLLLSQWADRLARPAAWESRRQRHLDLVRGLATSASVDEDKLLALFQMRHRPIFLQLGQLVTALMLGRFFLTVGAALATPLILLLVPWPTAPALVASMFLGVLIAHGFLAAGRLNADPRDAMAGAAARIRNTVSAPIVVMGHSHHPMAQRLRRGGWYFNTGTWVGGHDKLRNFTHLMIERGRDGAKAALCQWRDGRSWELRAERAGRNYTAPWGLRAKG